MTRNDTSIAFGILSLLAVVLLISTLPQHVKVRNTGTLLMIGWGAIGNLTQGISSLLLASTEVRITPSLLRWCDFSGALVYVYPFGFSAGMLVLLRRLESIASTRRVSQSTRDKRRALFFDLILGLALPPLLVPMRIVVQGHRMDIISGITCAPPLYASVPAIFLSQLPPLILSTVNFVFACLVLRWFILRRRQFAALLHTSGSGLSQRKYLRLMTLACAEIVLAWPVSIFVFVYNVAYVGFRSYTSWSEVHSSFDRVWILPIDQFPMITRAAVELTRWLGIVLAVVFFAFFGLPTEAWQQHSKNVQRTVATMFSRMKRATSSANPSTAVPDMSYSLENTHDIEAKEHGATAQHSEWMFMSRLRSQSDTNQVVVSSERVLAL